MDRKIYNTTIYNVIALSMVLVGLLGAVASYGVSKALADHDVELVEKWYGPASDRKATYADLYQFTIQVVNHRNFYGRIVWVCVPLVVAGLGCMMIMFPRFVKRASVQNQSAGN